LWQKAAPAKVTEINVSKSGVIIFGLTLLAVAIFRRHSLSAALAGLIATVLYKLVFTSFEEGAGLPGLAIHFRP
jgi:hypothetical protein